MNELILLCLAGMGLLMFTLLDLRRSTNEAQQERPCHKCPIYKNALCAQSYNEEATASTANAKMAV